MQCGNKSQTWVTVTASQFIGTEEEGDTERDPGRMDRKEREKRRDSEGQPPPIPEKVSISA